jgi:hypothetical protein
MKLVPPDTRLKDYKKRRSAFLEELIASTPNVSVRAVPAMDRRKPTSWRQ